LARLLEALPFTPLGSIPSNAQVQQLGESSATSKDQTHNAILQAMQFHS
jgi:hypothetical protein